MKNSSLIAVGDISFGDHFVCTSFGVNSFLNQNPDVEIFEHVKQWLSEGDIIFGNLETVLSDSDLKPGHIDSIHMRGKKEYIKHLKSAGFNVLHIANNHILQHGKNAFQETVELLIQNNITVVGLAEENGYNCRPAYKEINGREIVFLGYGFEKDLYYKGTTLYAQGEEEFVLEDIRKYKNKDNLLICSFHWGNEFIGYPSYKQMQLGRKAIEAGCDLILGHHPHVINGYEEYLGKQIMYSLGNFVFDQLWNENCTLGMIASFNIAGGIQLNKLYPVKISKKYQPFVIESQDFSKKIEDLNNKLRTNFAEQDRNYLKDYLELEKNNRYQSWFYMIKSIFRYKFFILTQIVKKTILRKLFD